MAAQGKLYVAKESFHTEVDGVPITVVANATRVREGHPLMAGRAHLFAEITPDYEWEQAVDEPRAVRRASAKAKQ